MTEKHISYESYALAYVQIDEQQSIKDNS